MWSKVNHKIKFTDQKDSWDRHRIGFIKSKASCKWKDSMSEVKKLKY